LIFNKAIYVALDEFLVKFQNFEKPHKKNCGFSGVVELLFLTNFWNFLKNLKTGLKKKLRVFWNG